MAASKLITASKPMTASKPGPLRQPLGLPPVLREFTQRSLLTLHRKWAEGEFGFTPLGPPEGKKEGGEAGD
jgi:hypothetical protein